MGKNNCNQGYQCPTNKVCNTKTGRCISKDGILGQMIIIDKPIKNKIIEQPKCEIEYRDKFFIIRGEDTKQLKEEFKKLQGKWNGTPGILGWTFKNNSLSTVIQLLTDNKLSISKKKPSPIKIKSNVNNTKNCNQGYQCPDNKVCNTKSGRCVNKKGITTKLLVNKSSPIKIKSKNKTKKLKVVDNNTINVEKDCINDELIMEPGTKLSTIDNKKIYKNWNNECYDIEELADILVGTNGQNKSPLEINIGKDVVLWKTKKQLLEIVNHKLISDETKQELMKILENELSDIPTYIRVFLEHPQLLHSIADKAIIILSDYDNSDFTPSLEALGGLNEEIEQLTGELPNIIRNITNNQGKKLITVLQEVDGNCIHGAGFYLAGYYCKIYLEIENYIKNYNINKPMLDLHPGYFRLSNISNECFLYGYVIPSMKLIDLCIYYPNMSQGKRGGTGRIGSITPTNYTIEQRSVFGFEYSKAETLARRIKNDYNGLFYDSFIPYYLQRYYDNKNMLQANKPKPHIKIANIKKVNSKKIKQVVNGKKSCKKSPNGNKCTPYNGPMDKKCMLSTSNRCIYKK